MNVGIIFYKLQELNLWEICEKLVGNFRQYPLCPFEKLLYWEEVEVNFLFLFQDADNRVVWTWDPSTFH